MQAKRTGRTGLIVLAVVALLAAGCSDGGDDEDGAPGTTADTEATVASTAAPSTSTTSGGASTTTTTTGGGGATTTTTGATATTMGTVPPEVVEDIELEIDQEIDLMVEELRPPDTDAPPPPLELAVALTEPTVWIQDDGADPRICGPTSPATTTVVVTPTDGVGIELVAVRAVVGGTSQVIKPPANSLGSYEATVGPFDQGALTTSTTVPLRVTVLDVHGRRADWTGEVSAMLGDLCRGG